MDNPPQRLAAAMALTVIGLAVGLGIFIQWNQGQTLRTDDVPRAIAVPAPFAATGLVALVGALQRRRWIVMTAGVLCIAGIALSYATLVFILPGLILGLVALRLRPGVAENVPGEILVAVLTFVLIVGSVVALLTMTEPRCFEVLGSPASPTIHLIPCGSEPTLVGGPGGGFASGEDSAALTLRGVAVEGALLLIAVALVVATGRGSRAAETAPTVDRRSNA
jgi:hypothetical protein